MVEPYQQQLRQQTATYSGASAESFGAAAGRGLEEAGEAIDRTIHRHREQERDRRRDEEAASAGVAFAEISTELDKQATDARLNAGPGAAGHSDAIAKGTDERIAAALGGITDERVRNAYKDRYADLKGRLYGREYAWEAGERVTKLVTDVDRVGTVFANREATNPTPDGLASALSEVETPIRLMAGLPDAVKEKAIREQQRKITVAWGNAMQVKDPAALGQVIEAGTLNSYLEPEDIDALRSGALVEQRRLDALAKAERARGEADARETLSLGLNKVNDGYIPTDEEWTQWRGLATTYKLEGKAWDLGVAKGRVEINRETRDWTLNQWSENVSTLEAKGDKRTAAEDVRLKLLQDARPKAEAKLNGSVHELGASRGDPAPEIDWENPTAEQGAARASWNRRQMDGNGTKPALLSPFELQQAKQRVEDGGIAGQIQVAQTMRTLFGVKDGTAALKQIDGNNRDLQLMVGLSANTAKDYRLGIEALNRHQKLNPRELAGETFVDYARAIPEEMQTPVLNAARAIAAHELSVAGNIDPTEDEYQDVFKRAVQRAAGATGTNGGFIRWGEDPLWIPPDIEKGEAIRRLSRALPADIIDAHSNATGDGPGGAPYYLGGDGKLHGLDRDQLRVLLKQSRLVSVRPGIFQVLGRDGKPIVNKNRQPWQFDIRKLK